MEERKDVNPLTTSIFAKPKVKDVIEGEDGDSSDSYSPDFEREHVSDESVSDLEPVEPEEIENSDEEEKEEKQASTKAG